MKNNQGEKKRSFDVFNFHCSLSQISFCLKFLVVFIQHFRNWISFFSHAHRSRGGTNEEHAETHNYQIKASQPKESPLARK
jgi:hypothetical protein